MTRDEMQELKRLAQAATPGPWETSDKVEDEGNVEIPIGRRTPLGMLTVAVAMDGLRARDANADFIAAANPAAVLALIARIEELESKR